MGSGNLWFLKVYIVSFKQSSRVIKFPGDTKTGLNLPLLTENPMTSPSGEVIYETFFSGLITFPYSRFLAHPIVGILWITPK